MNSSALVGGRFLLGEGAGHLLAAIHSLKVHGYDKGYMLQATRKIR
jgi:hypothetical protein